MACNIQPDNILKEKFIIYDLVEIFDEEPLENI